MAVAELVKRPLAVALSFTAVDSASLKASAYQFFGQSFHAALCFIKNQCFFNAGVYQQVMKLADFFAGVVVLDHILLDIVAGVALFYRNGTGYSMNVVSSIDFTSIVARRQRCGLTIS